MKDRNFQFGALASLLLHGLMILLLFGAITRHSGHKGQDGDGDKNGQGQQKQDTAGVDKFLQEGKKKDDTVEVTLMDKDDLFAILDKHEAEEKAHKDAVEKCPPESSYGGVGIENNYNGTVETVAEFYPAGRAGVEVGDRILNFDELRGTPGTTVMLYWLQTRTGEKKQALVTREKICYQPQKRKRKGP